MPSGNNYHIPYCPQCRTYVQPQVIAVTTVSGYGGNVGSRTDYGKRCPLCGDAVASQADRDARQASVQNQILYLGIGSLFCGIVAIITFCLAAAHRPLNAAGKAGVILSILALCFYLLFLPLVFLALRQGEQMDAQRHRTSHNPAASVRVWAEARRHPAPPAG